MMILPAILIALLLPTLAYSKCFVVRDAVNPDSLAVVQADGFVPKDTVGECPQGVDGGDGGILRLREGKVEIDKNARAERDAERARIEAELSRRNKAWEANAVWIKARALRLKDEPLRKEEVEEIVRRVLLNIHKDAN